MSVDDPVEEVDEIDAVLDALPSPDSQDVYQATRLYNGHTLAAVAAHRALQGAGGGVTDHGALSGLADDDHLQYHTDARGDARYLSLTTTLDEIDPPAAAVNLNNQKVTGLGTPTLDTDAATKAYADAIAQGLDVKLSVKAATTAAITLSGEQTIDGVAVVATDRVLVKNQAAGAANGIYVAAAGAWARSTDADVSGEVTAGMFTFVEAGTANADQGWVLATNNPITLGTTALVFTQFSGAGGTPTGAAGGDLTGSSYPDPVIAANAITTTKILDDAVTAAKIAANAVGSSELADSAVDTSAIQDGAVTLAKLATGIGYAPATVFNLDDPQYGIAGNGTTDDSAAIQAVINALPANGAVIMGAKRYKCNTTIDLSGKASLRFLGLTGTSYVDTHGMQFRCGTVGMDLFTINNNATVMMAGPVFEWANFYDPVGGCTLARLTKTNRWGFRNCFFGGFGQANPSTAINAVAGTGGDFDSAWWFVDECTFRVFGLLAYTSGKGGLLVGPSTQGGTVKGGAFLGCYPAIEDFGGEGLRVVGAKIDNGGIRLSGNRAKIIGVTWEPQDNNAIGIRVVTGVANQIHAFSANDGGAITGDVGIQIDAAASGTIVNGATFQNISTPWTNNGVASRLDFSQSHSPTITGSRGGNGAVTDLLTQLAARGVIQDSTTFTNIGSLVQKNFAVASGVTTTTTTKPAVGLTINVGQTAIIGAACDATQSIASVTDSGGNTWTVDYTGGSGQHISFASCPVTTQLTNASTITVTWSDGSSHNVVLWLFGISGLAASPFDKSAGATATSASANSGPTATLTQANEIAIAISRFNGDPLTWTKGTGWTDALNPYSNAASCEWKAVADTSPITATGTWGASQTWQCHVVTYKGATVSP